MSKTTIYLKSVHGILEYRDSDNHQGKTITTHVKPGGKIIWQLDRDSGISEITNISIKGDESILEKGPRKIDFDHWEAIAADSVVGELAYFTDVVNSEAVTISILEGGVKPGDERPPILKFP